MAINISISNNKLNVDTELTTKLEFYVDNNLKWIENDSRTGLISSDLTTEYFTMKFGGRLVMINRNKILQDFSESIEDISDENVKWYDIDTKELLGTGLYYNEPDGKAFADEVSGKLELVGNTLYVYGYIKQKEDEEEVPTPTDAGGSN